MRRAAITAALALSLLSLPPLQAPASAAELPPPIPRGRALQALAASDSVLLALRGGAQGETLLRAAGGTLVSGALRLWRVNGAAATQLVPLLDREGLLRYAEPDRVRATHDHLEQGDPLLPLAWHLQRIGADAVEPPGPGVAITLIDTGIDMKHPEFATRPGVELLNEQVVPPFGDLEYHGTIVASTAGAPSDGVGTVGVYPQAVLRSWDLRSLRDADIIAGIDAAIAAGKSVINLSLGGPGYSRSLYEAVMRAAGSGSLVVAAAGNDFLRGDPVVYPAAFPHVLTVGATDVLSDAAIFTGSRSRTDLAAPGVDIPVLNPDDPEDHPVFYGTSLAAPIVSAAAAWVWSARPELDAVQVFELLRRTATDVSSGGFDSRTGFGIIDIPAALEAPAPLRDPLEPNDDIDLVAARQVFSIPKPALTGANRRQASLAASLDRAEDPRDVYRVFVPAGRSLAATVAAGADVGATLWRLQTKTVLADGAAARRNQLDSSNRPGVRSEQVAWHNTGARGVTIYLEVWLPPRTARTEYDLDIRVR